MIVNADVTGVKTKIGFVVAVDCKLFPRRLDKMRIVATFLVVIFLAGCAKKQAGWLSDWEWIRESPDEWSVDDGVLKVRTQPDRIWAGEGSKNMLVAKQPTGARAVAEADVELVDAINKWEQCGLLVYGDDDHFVKLVVEHIDGPHYAVMAQEIGKQRQVLSKVEIPSNRAQLKMVVDGTTVHGFWRLEGEESWNDASVAAPIEFSHQRFGLFTQDGPRDETRYAWVRGLHWETTEK